MLFLFVVQATAQLMGPPLPADWQALAPLPYIAVPQVTPAMIQFVAGEVATGRCNTPRAGDGHYYMRVDVAALVSGDGVVRKVLPRAIDCPTVEQYSAGLVIGFARDNLRMHGESAADQWYRTTLSYDWGK